MDQVDARKHVDREYPDEFSRSRINEARIDGKDFSFHPSAGAPIREKIGKEESSGRGEAAARPKKSLR